MRSSPASCKHPRIPSVWEGEPVWTPPIGPFRCRLGFQSSPLALLHGNKLTMVLADVQTSSHVRAMKQSWLVQSLFSLVQTALNGLQRRSWPASCLPQKERGAPTLPQQLPESHLEYLPLTVLLHLPKFSDVASATLNLGGQI